MIYDRWGFIDNPFKSFALNPNEEGENLLKGRDKEKRKIKNRLLSRNKITTLEGINGIGKTSLINVAAYELFKECLENFSKPAIMPCLKVFQVSSDMDIESFIDDVYFTIADTLLKYKDRVERFFATPGDSAIERWLKSPFVNSIQVGVSVLSLGGINGGNSSSTNTSSGFDKHGFRSIVNQWLSSLYEIGGGVVCTIDNIELLQSSEAARRALETLRDKLLSTSGLIWVFSGANGIITSITSSARLTGILYQPLQIESVSNDHICELINARVEHFKKDGYEPYLPFVDENVQSLYTLLKGNLRGLLGYLDDYCMYTIDIELFPEIDTRKNEAFIGWLDLIIEKTITDIKSAIRPKAYEVFEGVLIKGGSFSPSQFAEFGFSSAEALRPYVKELEDVGLITSIKDEIDQRRKTSFTTAKANLISRNII